MATVITTATGLQNMKLDLTADYELGANIDCSTIANFEPIGGWNAANAFTGNFDGKGFQIFNFVVNRAADDYIGLFGEVDGGLIQNVILSATLTGDDYVGGLIGHMISGTVDRVTTAVTIVADRHGIGGVVGRMVDGTVRNSSCSGTITAGWYTGGFVGWMEDGLIEDCHSSVIIANGDYSAGGFMAAMSDGLVQRCYATGSVTTTRVLTNYLGGFIGTHTWGTIRQCYATGAVTDVAAAASYVGGFIGWFQGSGVITTIAYIKDCYSRGAATATGYAGGFCGIVGNVAELINSYSTGAVAGGIQDGGFLGADAGVAVDAYKCFWDKTTSGKNTSQGTGEVGKTTAEMQDISTFSNAGWDISRIWAISATCNGAYPCLISVNACCPGSMAPPADPTIAPKKVVLELIRNLEIMNGARFFIARGGNAHWESRFHRG